MRARSTSSPAAISASSNACRLAICKASQCPLALQPHLVDQPLLGDPRRLDLLGRDDLGPLALALGLGDLHRLGGKRDLALAARPPRAPRQRHLQLLLLALPLDPRLLQRQLEGDLLALGQLARGQLGRLQGAAAADLEALRGLLVLDARLGEAALLRHARLLDLLVRGDLRLLGFLVAQRALGGELGALHRTAYLDLALLLQPRVLAVAVDLEHLALRLQVLGADRRPACAARSRCASGGAPRSSR